MYMAQGEPQNRNIRCLNKILKNKHKRSRSSAGRKAMHTHSLAPVKAAGSEEAWCMQEWHGTWEGWDRKCMWARRGWQLAKEAGAPPLAGFLWPLQPSTSRSMLSLVLEILGQQKYTVGSGVCVGGRCVMRRTPASFPKSELTFHLLLTVWLREII